LIHPSRARCIGCLYYRFSADGGGSVTGRIWLYAGSVQTLEYVTREELPRSFLKAGRPLPARQL